MICFYDHGRKLYLNNSRRHPCHHAGVAERGLEHYRVAFGPNVPRVCKRLQIELACNSKAKEDTSTYFLIGRFQSDIRTSHREQRTLLATLFAGDRELQRNGPGPDGLRSNPLSTALPTILPTSYRSRSASEAYRRSEIYAQNLCMQDCRIKSHVNSHPCVSLHSCSVRSAQWRRFRRQSRDRTW